MSNDLPYDFDPDENFPDWSLGGKTHNWRNHVSISMRAMWSKLAPDVRTVLARDADERASKEEWE